MVRAEEGIEAEIIRVASGASAVALSSGDLDYGTGMSVGSAMTGLPFKVVACFVPAPVLALVARPELKSVQELKGKTVGISNFAGLSIFLGLPRGRVRPQMPGSRRSSLPGPVVSAVGA